MSCTPLLSSPPLVCDTWSQQISDVTSTFLTAQFAARRTVAGETAQVEKSFCQVDKGKEKKVISKSSIDEGLQQCPSHYFQ